MTCKKKSTHLAFTLAELMAVIVILGIISAISFRFYHNVIERSYARDAIINLISIHAAQQIYRARNGAYWPVVSTWQNTDAINTNLELNLSATEITYQCRGTGSLDGTTYRCRANRNAPAPLFRYILTQAPITTTNDPGCTTSDCNPGCREASGSCP